MTPKQRTAFFKLFNDAWTVSGTGREKDAWRKAEMAEAVPSYTSTKRRITVADFEKLMLHFATLAQDADAIIPDYALGNGARFWYTWAHGF